MAQRQGTDDSCDRNVDRVGRSETCLQGPHRSASSKTLAPSNQSCAYTKASQIKYIKINKNNGCQIVNNGCK